MYRSFSSNIAACLLALIPTTLAAGSAIVVNNCDFDVYYASVAQSVASPMQKLPSSGYSEPFQLANDGISIKMATVLNGPVTQFEFTWDAPTVAYDISNINGNPFAQYGTSLVPSQIGASGYPSCVAIDCPAGQSTCSAAYNQPDDVATKVCPDSSDLTFTLCTGNSGGGSSPGQSSQQSPVAASSPVASSAPAFLQSQVASSVPAFTQTQAATSAPTFSKTPTVPSASVPSFQFGSAPAVASPSGFRTSTTPAAYQPAPSQTGFNNAAPSAPAAVQSSSAPAAAQPSSAFYHVPAASPAASLVQSASPVAAASTAPAAAPAAPSPAQTTAAAATGGQHSWGSWGGWGDWHGHYHTRRGHIHRFRS